MHNPLFRHTIVTLVLLTIALLSKVAAANDAPLWMRYPAISPDGSTVASCYKGDIYVAPVSGGTATLLTLNDAYDFMPVWSPDSKSLAFASDRYGNFDVFVMPASGGAACRLTYHSADDLPSTFTLDGRSIVFLSARLDAASCAQFPSGAMPEVYEVSVSDGAVRQLLTTPAEGIQFDNKGERLLYNDQKGYEDRWRKHHTSSIARDLWLYDMKTKSHSRLTRWEGEDRDPVWSPNDDTVYYLSERGGSFNIWRMPLAEPEATAPVTTHTKHPVRFLTISDSGDLCYGFNGEIFVRPAGTDISHKLEIHIAYDDRFNQSKHIPLKGSVSDLALSPNGKEIAFVIRGEIFVTDVNYGVTKRITNTPEQERSVSFSPDGRSLLYAGERNNLWRVYQSTIADTNEPYFYNSTLLREELIVDSEAESFEPSYSPDGQEVAFLEERTALKVINLKTHQTRLIFPAETNYSYLDGDQWYQWSPDGKWFLAVNNRSGDRWSDEVALIDSRGEKGLVNLTRSGYEDNQPKWMMDGKMMIWSSSRYGRRNHGSWGFDTDVMGMFFTMESWDRFNLSEAEIDILKEKEDEAKKVKEGDDSKKDKDKGDKGKAPKLPDPVPMELDGLDDRTVRLTTHSSQLADALLTSDGETLYYLARFEKGFDLWSYKHRKSEVKLLIKLDAQRAGSLAIDSAGKNLFLLADGEPVKIELPEGKKSNISYSASMDLQPAREREYLFAHVWRQMLKKFYVKDMHGVDWAFYKQAYEVFLPHINNNYDFAEMLSEMLGELNASHTGSGYIRPRDGADATASLGAFFDEEYAGRGLRILEIMEKSPLQYAGSKIKSGTIIEQIDGIDIPVGEFYMLLNLKAGKPVRLALRDERTGEHWSETVKPISLRSERELTYQRWVRSRRTETERLSGGRIGYVHVRSMDDNSFRRSFADILGRYADKEALVVDTRFNGGGNLHDELATFLAGRKYFQVEPRSLDMGEEPWEKWNRPSVVIMSESNYSDAHMFPFVYRDLGIGKLVGMPVPGTGTSVWWETLQDTTLYFGIPEVGYYDRGGKFLENQQLEPDYRVENEPGAVAGGRDQMLEKAVEVLLEELDQKR